MTREQYGHAAGVGEASEMEVRPTGATGRKGRRIGVSALVIMLMALLAAGHISMNGVSA